MSRLFLSRSEKRGLLVLLFLLLCVSGGILYVRNSRGVGGGASLSPTDSVKFEAFKVETNAREAKRKSGAPISVEAFPFNPNTADSTTLLRLGLKPWQIKNLMAYRRAGGRCLQPDGWAR